MAIAFVANRSPATLVDGANGSSYNFTASAAISSASNVAVVFVQACRASANPVQPTLSGLGMTWTFEAGVTDTAGTIRNAVWMFHGSGTPSGTTLTVDFAGTTHTNCGVVIGEFSGVDQSDPTVQSGTNSGTTGTTATVTLGAAPTSSMVVGGVSTQTGEAPTAGTSFTNIDSEAGTSPVVGFAGEYQAANDQSIDFTWTTSAEWRIVGAELRASSGTLYTSTPAGTVTSSGALARKPATTKAGTVTSAGALARQLARSLAGTTTSSGNLARRLARTLTGTTASSGALSSVRTVLVGLAGTITSAGALARRLARTLAGTTASSGALARRLARSLAGTVTSAGALARRLARTLAGTVTSSGAITRRLARTVSGAVSTAGALVRRLARSLAGTITSSGSTTADRTGATGPDSTTRGVARRYARATAARARRVTARQHDRAAATRQARASARSRSRTATTRRT